MKLITSEVGSEGQDERDIIPARRSIFMIAHCVRMALIYLSPVRSASLIVRETYNIPINLTKLLERIQRWHWDLE